MTYTTDQYEGMIAQTVAIPGHNGDWINTYVAQPLGPGPFPGMVLIHHFPGWDEWYKEATRKMAHHGYFAICPDLYHRVGHGSPQDVAATVRGQGGVPDPGVVGDVGACVDYLKAQPELNGKVGVMGTCSGGRHTFLAACQLESIDAAADLWGGRVVMAPADLTPNFPVAPIDLTKDLKCPLLGLFGNDDRGPTAEQVDQHEAALKQHGKEYEFHRYDGAGHGFFYHHTPNYRQEAAVDGWNKLFAFFEKHLS
jgi:carboxymethylenebutenolidase